jgi:hypothetical protein
MQTFNQCANIEIDGDEHTSGFLGLHWFPSAGASATKEHYEADVLTSLKRLVGRYIGWCVINEIFYQRPRKMTILPYHPTASDPVNAYASPTDRAAATMKDTTALDSQGNLPGPGKDRIVGTGAGSSSIINFTPSIFSSGPGGPSGPGATADEILLHEMLHALRQMTGRAVREAVSGNPGMDNYEEFAAIVVTNVYRSELGLPQLRRDHHGFLALTGPTATTAGFKAAFSQYLNFMDVEQPRLCNNLRQARVGFNPFI